LGVAARDEIEVPLGKGDDGCATGRELFDPG
jgi:hypothetical protein